MTLVIPAGSASVIHSLKMTGDPDPYAITYGVQMTGDPADLNVVAADLHSAYDTNINPNNTSLLVLNETIVKYNPLAAPGVYVEGVAATPAPGAGGSTAIVPQNTALLVHKRTGAAGRTGRGRMYFPALNEVNVDAVGAIAPSWISTMNTALAAWLADIDAVADIDFMCLLHDSAGAGALLAPFEVTALTTDPTCATQRRRLRK